MGITPRIGFGALWAAAGVTANTAAETISPKLPRWVIVWVKVVACSRLSMLGSLFSNRSRRCPESPYFRVIAALPFRPIASCRLGDAALPGLFNCRMIAFAGSRRGEQAPAMGKNMRTRNFLKTQTAAAALLALLAAPARAQSVDTLITGG